MLNRHLKVFHPFFVRNHEAGFPKKQYHCHATEQGTLALLVSPPYETPSISAWKRIAFEVASFHKRTHAGHYSLVNG